MSRLDKTFFLVHYQIRCRFLLPMFKSTDEQKVELPTFKQLAAKNYEFNSEYYVDGFWFPGQFKQLTIVTSDFRIGLDSRSNAVQDLISEIHKGIQDGAVFKIKVVNSTPKEWELLRDEDYEAEYRFVGGDSGAFVQGSIKPVLPPSINPRSRKK